MNIEVSSIFKFYAGWMLLLTVITFLSYGWDKWMAKREAWRTPEKTLHSLSLLGGFIGAALGRSLFRHKTLNPVFTVVIVLSALLHVGGVLLVAYYF